MKEQMRCDNCKGFLGMVDGPIMMESGRGLCKGCCWKAVENGTDKWITERASTPTVDGSTSTTGKQETPRMLRTKCSTYTLVETERRLPSSMTADEDDENGLLLLTKIEIKVYGDKVVLEYTDDGMEREPIDITGTALGELLLKAVPTK